MPSSSTQTTSQITPQITGATLDTEWLARLHTDLGSRAEFMVLLVGDYAEAAHEFLAAAGSGADAEVVCDLAHSLAGASGLLGLRVAMNAAQRVEASASIDDIAALAELLPSMLVALDDWVTTL